MSGGSENFGASLANYSPQLGGAYAPADFGDAEDTRPLEVLLDPTGTGTSAPYTTIVYNSLARHTQEIRDKSVLPPLTTSSWRKRIRDYLQLKNDDILGFLRRPLQQHPTLGQAEAYLRRFGRPDFQASMPALRDVQLDISGASLVGKIEQELQAAKPGPVTFPLLADQIKWIYDSYRQTGEDILRLDATLKQRLDVMNRSQQVLVSLLELPVNEATQQLTQSTEAFLSKVYEKNTMEDTYQALIEAYRRFAALREIVQFLRHTETVDKEPLCSICLNESVAFALSPCGHTFCQTCSKRQMTICYVCRQNIRERVRIYFG